MVLGSQIVKQIKIHNSRAYCRIPREKNDKSHIARIRTGSDVYLLKIVNDVFKQDWIVPKYDGKLYIKRL
jgi:hypothetical protein